MATDGWRSWEMLETVPRDGSQVLFWVPENENDPFGNGEVCLGRYDAPLDYYIDGNGDEIEPIAWMNPPRGPNSIFDLGSSER
jgi:hypothetical protein